MEKSFFIVSLIMLILVACGGNMPAAAPTQAATLPASTATAVVTAATIADMPAENPVELVWTLTGDPNRFNSPDGIAIDQQNNLYVMDSGNARIQKFDSDGSFIGMWGSRGNADGEFSCSPFCMVAVDRQGNVFVTDNNHRVQKFDSSGVFLTKWGSLGSEDGQFNSPFGIAVDQQGNVYVSDVGNARIQKFDGNGNFLAKWGSPGREDGQFSEELADIAVDSQGNVFVTDRANGILKFGSDGQFLSKLDTCGDDRIVTSATGVAVDAQDNLYVFDLSSTRLCKYDKNGNFVSNWEGSDTPDGRFSLGGGVAVDQQGNVYVSELSKGRVRKFRQR